MFLVQHYSSLCDDFTGASPLFSSWSSTSSLFAHFHKLCSLLWFLVSHFTLITMSEKKNIFIHLLLIPFSSFLIVIFCEHSMLVYFFMSFIFQKFINLMEKSEEEEEDAEM